MSTELVINIVNKVCRLVGYKRLLGCFRFGLRFISSAGAMLGISSLRFFGLQELAETALRRDDLNKASRLAQELLQLAEKFPGDWNYGNAIHHGNKILGLRALQKGQIAEAERYLLASGRCPGSPQLNSFGPSMRLAEALLQRRSRVVVLDYLEACKAFWIMETDSQNQTFRAIDQLDAWSLAVRRWEIPDFRPNNRY